MTEFDISRAIEDISGEYIIGALELSAGKKRNPVLRRFVYAAVAVLLLTCSFITVMALSEDLRLGVYRLFKVNEPDHVYDVSNGTPIRIECSFPVFTKDLDEMPSIRFAVIPSDSQFMPVGDVYFHRSEYLFYKLDNGEYIRLDTSETSTTYDWENNGYSIEFYYCIYEGRLYLFYQNNRGEGDLYWYLSAMEGRTDTAILTLSNGRQADYSERAFVLDVSSGEITDVFESAEGVLTNMKVKETQFATDLSRAVLTADKGDKTYYYCFDTENKTLTDIAELVGEPVSGAWLINDEYLFAYSVSGEALTVFGYSLEREELYYKHEGYTLFTEKSGYGISLNGRRYAPYIESDGTLYVMDLLVGAGYLIDGFKYSGGNISFSANRAGNKILYTEMKPEGGSLCISAIGVIDTEKQSFTLLQRNGDTDTREVSVGWNSDSSIQITCEDPDGNRLAYIYEFDK